MVLPGNVDSSNNFFGEYQMVVTHPTTGVILDIVEQGRIEHLKYSRKINEVGIMTLTIDSSDSLSEFIDQVDLIFDIYRRNEPNGSLEYEDSYFLQMYNRSQVDDQGNEKIIFSCVSLEDLLKRRRILPDDDPLGAGGFSTKSGDAAFIISQFINEQLINPFTNEARKISQVRLTDLPVIPFYNTQQRRNQSDTLLKVCQDIVNQTDLPVLDFHLIHTGFAIIDVIIKARGADKTATTNTPLSQEFLFISTRRGNLRNPELVIDRRREINSVFVAGQGIGASRVFVNSTSTRVNDSPFNRKESVIDQKVSNAVDELIDAGAVEIVNKRPIEELNFEFYPGGAQTIYNVDWELGDRITVGYETYLEDHRITEVEITLRGSSEDIKFSTGVL